MSGRQGTHNERRKKERNVKPNRTRSTTIKTRLPSDQTSVWDDQSFSTTNDKSYATDFESYSDNSLESSGDEDESPPARGSRTKRALVVCGESIPEGIPDASMVYVKSFLETTRDVSFAIGRVCQREAVAKAKMAKAYMGELEQARKDEMERQKEARRVAREKLRQEEIRVAREDLRGVANMWREK